MYELAATVRVEQINLNSGDTKLYHQNVDDMLLTWSQVLEAEKGQIER